MSEDDEIRESSLRTVKVLGQGAFATVSLCAYTPAPGHEPCLVACKRLKPHLAQLQHEAEAFKNEVRIVRKLRHKHISYPLSPEP